ncbi:hypothetical protein GCM10010170_030840 [Dactylosporangium salmoneum]|uniref:DUF1616 domain-containing protein n=2 Tax=Dactylosporangium salmoneum TaxID=53361 RepID=A0ABP5T3R2_9ACTN
MANRKRVPSPRQATGMRLRRPATPRGQDGSRPPTVWPPLLTLLAGAGVLALVLLSGPATVRAVAVLTYLAIVPGLACVRLIRLPDRLTRFILGVALSLALGVLVAQAMVELRRWSPTLGLCALVAIASLAALTELVRNWRTARHGRVSSS